MRGCAGDISTSCSMPVEQFLMLPRRCTHVLGGIIGHPADEGDLVALSAVLLKLDVVHSVAAAETLDTSLVLALGADQLLTESFVVVLGGSLLNNDLLVVVGDLEDDPLGALAELEVVECSDAVGVDGNTGE